MKITTLTLYAALCCALPMQAQQTLGLKECREMALKHNKELAAAGKQTLSARYTARSYRANFFPNIAATATGLYSNADGSLAVAGGNLPTFLPDATGQPVPNGGFAYFPGLNLDYKIGWAYMGGIKLEQPLYMGGKIRAAYRIARLGQQMAQMGETLTANEVVVKTDRAYALVVKAREMKDVARTYNELLGELMRNVESAHKHGLKPKNDVLKVKVKLNESELDLRKADNALKLATMNLCHLIGRPLTDEISVSGDYPDIGDADTGEAGTDVSARPEYGILEQQVAIAGQQVRLSRSEMLPQIGLQGSYQYVHGGQLNQHTLLDKASFAALLNVSIPLYHFGERSNKVKAAKAQLQQARLQQQDLTEQLILEQVQAANNLDEARLESRLAERSLQQAEENRRVSRGQYDAGLETLSDHLEAQALWQQAYAAHVDARFQLYLHYVEYLKATGRLVDDPR